MGVWKGLRRVASAREVANLIFVTFLLSKMRRFVPVSFIRRVVSGERIETTVSLRNDAASFMSTKPLPAVLDAPSHRQPLLQPLLLMSPAVSRPQQQQLQGSSQQGGGSSSSSSQSSASSSYSAHLLRYTAAGLALLMGLGGPGRVHARAAGAEGGGGAAEAAGSDGLIESARGLLSVLWQELQDDLDRAKAASGGDGYPGPAAPPVLTSAPPAGMQATLTLPRWEILLGRVTPSLSGLMPCRHPLRH